MRQALVDSIGSEVANGLNRVRELYGQLGMPLDDKPLPRTREEFSKAAIAHKETLRFERLAEVHTWWRGPYETCKRIDVKRFKKLCTLPAHRYLARLAREGLIREIITTNYDTCIETAWRGTFSSKRSTGIKGPVVVRSLGEYRVRGSIREDRRGQPTLHVYKINGCAKAWAKSVKAARCTEEKNRASARIILSEAQLHSFRTDRWAEDLFRDRARSRALVFSGFGSDEPQVRYTLLKLAAEFRSLAEENGQTTSEIWEQGNAPFVTTFDDRLTFPQSQILRGFALTHSGKNGHVPFDQLVNEDEANVLTGRDASWLKEDGPSRHRDVASEPRLPADLLWMRVFQAAWGRLIRLHVQRGKPFFRWLENSGIHAPARVAEELVDWLYPENVSDSSDYMDGVFGRMRRLLSESGHGESSPLRSEPMMPLSAWMLAVQGRYHKAIGDRPWKRDYYLSLREDALLVLSVLLLVQKLLVDADPLAPKTVRPLSAAGLMVKMGDSYAVLATRDTAIEPHLSETLEEGSLIVRIILPAQSLGPGVGPLLMSARAPPGVVTRNDTGRARRTIRVVDVGADVVLNAIQGSEDQCRVPSYPGLRHHVLNAIAMKSEQRRTRARLVPCSTERMDD